MAKIRDTPLFNFIDDESLSSAEKQIQLAHARLSRRLHGNVPPLTELAAAMPELLDAEDARRAAKATSITPAPLDTPYLRDLHTLLELSNLSYLAQTKLLKGVGALGYSVLLQRDHSEKFAPAFFVCFREQAPSEICLVIRGTMEPADVLTDIAVAPEPFLGACGHGGIVRSASKLLAELSQPLAKLVSDLKPARVVLTGHSLGAASASALTMLWRAGVDGADALKTVECVAFCPVPIVSDMRLAVEAEGITAIVNGVDVFPRLSVPSLDRMFLRLATSEVAESARASMRRNVVSAVAGAVEHGMRMMDSYVAKEKDASNDSGKEDPSHGKLAAGASLFAELKDTDMDVDVDGGGEGDEAVDQMFVAGKILHIEAPFPRAGYLFSRSTVEKGKCPFILREMHAAELCDIEISHYMVDDHFAPGVQTRIKEILDFSAKEGAPVNAQPQKVVLSAPV